MKKNTFSGWIRPLSFPSVSVFPSDSPIKNSEKEISPVDLINDLYKDGGYGEPDVIEKIKQRYLSLSTSELEIFVVPADVIILKKIVWQLRAAKRAFCIEDFIGCIALCGVVCEMAVIFVYDLMPDYFLKRLDFVNYEKDKQYRRIRKFVLLLEKSETFLNEDDKIRLIPLFRKAASVDVACRADYVRDIRNKYLHNLSQSDERLEEEARETYISAFIVVKTLFDLPVGNGAFNVPSYLEHYLESKKKN